MTINFEEILEFTVFNRQFELNVATFFETGHVRPPIYLSVGTEHIPPSILEGLRLGGLGLKDFAVFPQHRCHSYYLTFGGEPDKLAFELCGHSKGCNGGMGGSASVSNNNDANLFGHSGLLGDQVPIAVGYAHASDMPTIVILGDAAAEEDYALASLGYAKTKGAPVLFLCEDNDRSILTPKGVRRDWDLVSVAQGFGLEARGLKDEPQNIVHAVQDFAMDPQPTLINISCQRHLWHAGVGTDGDPKWNTYSEFLDFCRDLIGNSGVNSIIEKQTKKTESIWAEVISEVKRDN